MRNRITAMIAVFVAALGLGLVLSSPANAGIVVCFAGGAPQPSERIYLGNFGEAAVCDHSPNPGSDAVALNVGGVGSPLFALHDWTNDRPDGIYIEYQLWDNQNWLTLAGSTDLFGGPWTISDQGNHPAGFKYVRVRHVGTNSFIYIFKSTGAGGCGLMGFSANCPQHVYF